MTKSIPLKYSEILDSKRQGILPFLSVFSDKGFYLAGGTALALFSGHRESEDFDFFNPSEFDPNELLLFCSIHFRGFEVRATLIAQNTLWIEANGIKMSFFTLHAPLIFPPIDGEYMQIASVLDIAAMKLGAIQHRATEKDYIDMAYICGKYSLDQVLDVFDKKYGRIIVHGLLLKSLVYFDDVTPAPIRILDTKYTFENSKKILLTVVKVYLEKN